MGIYNYVWCSSIAQVSGVSVFRLGGEPLCSPGPNKIDFIPETRTVILAPRILASNPEHAVFCQTTRTPAQGAEEGTWWH
jgi:hypothetical protein